MSWIAFAEALLRWRRTIILGGAALAALILLASGVGKPLDDSLRELRNTLRRHAASGEIAIVEIDAASLARLDHWPWPRDVHARAVDQLHQAGAKLIAFDVDFSSRSGAADDAAFASALARAGGVVVLPTFRQRASAQSDRWVENLPLPSFREGSFLGAVNISPDGDGAVRRYPLGVNTAGVPRPSLAAMLAERPARADRSFVIDYATDPATIARYSFVDLIEGRVPADKLRGKRVVIGATAIELGDRYAVPGWGVIPGVVVQALAAETLLTQGVPADGGALLPLLLALLALWALAQGRNRRRRATLFAGGAATAILLLPLAAERFFATNLAVSPAFGALLVGGGLAALLATLGEFRRRRLEDIDTGLPNAQALSTDAAAQATMIVAVARIDNFSEIASSLGPIETPALIRRVSERLALGAGGSAIYRSDESALAWTIASERRPELDDGFAALAAVLRPPVACAGRAIDVRISFGVAEGAGNEARQIAAAAFLAASQAAESGERWRENGAGDRADADWNLSLASEIDDAIASGAIWVAYQPKFDLKRNAIVGSEALVRWQHPTRGAISPDRFIPVIEAHGRAEALTRHVLDTALSDAARWAASGTPLGVAVNISATLIADPGVADWITAALAQHGVPTSLLTLEVTESAAIASPEVARQTLATLRSYGIGVSIDDYGTGQSTMTYLKHLPASEVKIDKSFIQGIASSRSDAILVRSTIGLAHELGCKVVAEGVEDAQCLETLRALGCDLIQGWHIGRPMPADQFFMAATTVPLKRTG